MNPAPGSVFGAVATPRVGRDVLGLMIAAHETTTHLIGNGLLTLPRHPDALQKLRAGLGARGRDARCG